MIGTYRHIPGHITLGTCEEQPRHHEGKARKHRDNLHSNDDELSFQNSKEGVRREINTTRHQRAALRCNMHTHASECRYCRQYVGLKR
jgi:hypothetical protein